MKLSKGESRQKSPVTEQYKKIMRQYKSAIKRADAAGYKTQAIIPVVVPDQSKRSSTAKLKAAYKKFKASVQREHNVKLAEQRIATRNYNKFKRAAAKAKEKEEKVKAPKKEPVSKTSTAQERQREETTTPKQQPIVDAVRKKVSKTIPDYDRMAFDNIQGVIDKALNVMRDKGAKSLDQKIYFEQVETMAQDVMNALKSRYFYDPGAAGVIAYRVEMMYKRIQDTIVKYMWFDSQGIADVVLDDDTDLYKKLLGDLTDEIYGDDMDPGRARRIQRAINNAVGETSNGESGTFS